MYREEPHIYKPDVYVINDLQLGLEKMAAYGRLMLLGDSITQCSFSVGGWGSKVADHFQRRLDVFNRGYSGYNTTLIKCALPQILSFTAPLDAATVMLGSNDSALKEVNPEQHVPLEAFESNLRGICELLLNHGVPREGVLLVSPPPLCERVRAEVWRVV